MAGSFRNLEIWKEAHNLSLEIYKITNDFPKDERFSLVDQIRRSSSSISANIAESSGRYGKKDKIQLLMVARGSAYETLSHLSLAYNLGYITASKFEELDNRYELLAKRINAFIRYLRKLKFDQPKSN